MKPSLQEDRAKAVEVLARLRTAFDAGVAALARSCASGSRIDNAKADRMQLASFELAWAAAELLAAETSSAFLGARAGEIDVRLAVIFAGDAAPEIIDRLQTVYRETGLDASALDGMRPAVAALRQGAVAASALEAAGDLVTAAGGDVGTVKLDEQHELAQDAFRRFAAEVVAPMAEDIHRRDLTVPEALLQPMREMGVFGLAIPEKFGGSAPDDREDSVLMIAVTEALSEASLAAAGSLITRPEILARALIKGGTPEQQSYWLRKLAAGEPLCAIAITEPDYGSDVAALALRATRADGGWKLTGAKTWCTFAGKAGVIMVVARTDPDRSRGHQGLSVFLVEKPSFETHEFEVRQPGGGKLAGRAIPTIGYRGMHSFDLSFDDFFVSDAHLLGGEAGLGKGFYFTMAGMVGGRLQTSARACGVMRAALRAAVRYTQDRRVFGAPLAHFQLTKVKLARMAARFAACRQLAYSVAKIVDEGDGRMEASLAKLLACRSAEMLTREALQLHGGMGYAEESPVSRYFVDARVLSIFEGAEETLALKVIARTLLDSAIARPGVAA
ncbi:MAG TPA: acyl-CoA dehydrogenase family protein [Ramlibacter sp.]|uniref:acyl-CoA dehydrogenase family protein n=1 Tax=Ramlibacter sp. TaxID=1917967 RepID=UPI002BDD6033|nr:acyl-CoA dehydrogenase family protein [Ramlibacter sp.]HVZ44205.1 acyl-CoA dehydrogenase family protein [Ramlibacter sp.]